jgi:tetratricopeptide (TPR) repeat protein
MLKTLLAAFFALALAGGSALAAGSDPTPSPSPSPSASKPSKYEEAVNHIEAERYAEAVPLLEQVVQLDADNADAWNYLGFAYRNLERFDDAFAAYNQALLIDPDHDGANEYLGELYLMTGDLDSAEQQLQVLDDNCSFSCDEYNELKDAIAEYKTQHGS